MKQKLWLVPLSLAAFACALANHAAAAIMYSTVGSTYSQNFDSLPNSPTNTSLGSSPAGWTDDGVPIGLQIVGRRHADRTVLAAAAAFEAACPWRDRRPVQ